MATFLDMQLRINQDYLNRFDLGAETKNAIQRAIKAYEKERFWFNSTATALTVGTASNTVAIPADFLALDFATIRDASADYIITIRSFDRLAYRLQNSQAGGLSASGIAAEIAYHQDQLFFAPKPQSATTITIRYTQAFPALSADTDTNGFTSAAEDLIVFHAAADMVQNILRIADPTIFQGYKALEMEAYNNLKFGNDIRMGNDEQGIQGRNHSTRPKLPKKLMIPPPGTPE
jgi:hypothetical protein